MKVKEINFDGYDFENIMILTPKNFAWNRGTTFPPDSLERVLQIYGEKELIPEDYVSLDNENHTLTIKINEEFYPYPGVNK